jgi:diguanylate cyclase (GGDEF)-like protein
MGSNLTKPPAAPATPTVGDLRDRLLEEAAFAFDAWEHDALRPLLDRLDPQASPPDEASWIDLRQRLHGCLLRGQLAVRADDLQQATHQLARAPDLARRLEGLADSAPPSVLTLARADLAVADAYRAAVQEQVHRFGRVLAPAWRAAEAAPPGYLGDRCRVRAANAYASAHRESSPEEAARWARRARMACTETRLQPLARQAAGLEAEALIAAAGTVWRPGPSEAAGLSDSLRRASEALDWLEAQRTALSPHQQVSCQLLRAQWHGLIGQPLEAIHQLRILLQDCPSRLGADSRDVQAEGLCALADLLRGQGKAAEAGVAIQESLSLVTTLSLPRSEDRFRGVAADIARDLGHVDEEVSQLRAQRELRATMRLAASQRDARLGALALDDERARREVTTALSVRLRLELENLALEQQAELLAKAAAKDGLTGAANRRTFDSWMEEAHASARQTGRPLSLAYVDIDHFKRVNDQFGHPAGDAVLRRMTELLQAGVREGDLVARLGGEEFALVFDRSSWSQAVRACERVRVQVADHPWPLLVPGASVTVSIGLVDAADFATVPQACAEADRRLYIAKHSGRNRVQSQAPADENER